MVPTTFWQIAYLGSTALLIRLRLWREESHRPSSFFDDDEELYFLDQEYSGSNDDELWRTFECYLNLLETPHSDCNPLNYAHIHEQQQQDENLLALQAKNLTTMSIFSSSVTRKIPLKTTGDCLS